LITINLVGILCHLFPYIIFFVEHSLFFLICAKHKIHIIFWCIQRLHWHFIVQWILIITQFIYYLFFPGTQLTTFKKYPTYCEPYLPSPVLVSKIIFTCVRIEWQLLDSFKLTIFLVITQSCIVFILFCCLYNDT
jgi:hypothetical protein